MNQMTQWMLGCAVCGLLAGAIVSGRGVAQSEAGFVPLFDGRTLDGWKLVEPHGRGYLVEDGTIAAIGPAADFFGPDGPAAFVHYIGLAGSRAVARKQT